MWLRLFSRPALCRHWAATLNRCLATSIPTDHDVVIIGGGLMGCSTAYHVISHDPSLRVCIVEKDPSVSFKSHFISLLTPPALLFVAACVNLPCDQSL